MADIEKEVEALAKEFKGKSEQVLANPFMFS